MVRQYYKNLAYCTHNHKKIFKIALYALLGSITGAIFPYFIGMYFFDLIGKPIIEFYNFQNELDTFSQNIKDHGFMYVFVGWSMCILIFFKYKSTFHTQVHTSRCPSTTT